MKPIIYLLPLLCIVLGVLNYMYFAKDILSTILFLFLGIVAAIYNLMKKRFAIPLLSITLIICIVSLFSYVVNSGV